jgi:superfamily II DNA or RNA helicase
MRRWNGETPRLLRFYERAKTGLIVPRGYIRQLINLCRRSDVQFQLDDQRRALPEVDFNFSGKLKPFQDQAVKAAIAKDFGTLSAPTGSGKTVMALYIASWGYQRMKSVSSAPVKSP